MRARRGPAVVASLAHLSMMRAMPAPIPPLLRVLLGLALATGAVLAAAPAEVVPWGRALHSWFQRASWPALPALVSLVLILAARLMPKAQAVSSSARAAAPRRNYAAMAVGLLLLVEPLVHLLVLAWSAHRPSSASAEAVLPVTSALTSGAAGSWPAAMSLLTLTVLVPIAEEFFFRGRLLMWLCGHWQLRRWGTSAAVVVSSLAFAAAHAEVVQALFAIPLGVLLAFVRLRAGDLGGCMIAHACHNALFLFVGPVLIGIPWMAPVLATGGAVLIAVAWLHHHHPPSPQRHLRAVAAVLAAISVVLLSYPAYRRMQDWLWVRAAHQLVVYWRIDTDGLLMRLDHQRRGGRLDAARRGALYDLLCARPCQRFPGGTNPRQACVLALLDPERLAAGATADQAYDQLLDLADAHSPCAQLSEAARLLGLRFPEDFAAVATVNPEALRRWLPLPERDDAALAQLIVTRLHYHRMLLAALEHVFPGRVAAVLLRLPAERVTPLDRRHLFGNYPDAQERLNRLVRSDPQRAEAWGFGEEVP